MKFSQQQIYICCLSVSFKRFLFVSEIQFKNNKTISELKKYLVNSGIDKS